jgi:uncharacterized OsmC-like protein
MEATVYLAQKPLRARYGESPQQATVTDRARTCGPSPADPFHTRVEPMDGCGVLVPIGTHAAIGGPHDAPTPGDMLCAALAACQDSAFRMVANLLGITLTHLEVRVTASVDVRGTMAMDPAVPVGFQTIDCEVLFSAKAGTPAALLEKLQFAAERCCVVQQTLKAPPQVNTTFSEAAEQPGTAGTQVQAAQSSA